jgi:hypothetical protein
MGYNVHDVFIRIMVYNILNLTFKAHLFLYDLKLSTFFKMKHKICNLNIYILQIHIYIFKILSF